MTIKNRKRHKYLYETQYFLKTNAQTFLLTLILCFKTNLAVAQIIKHAPFKTLMPGLSYQSISPETLSPFAALHVFDIDLTKIEISICPINRLMTAAESVHQTKAIMAFNGAFFSTKNNPIGLRVSKGEILSPYKKISWWRIFSISNKQAEITKTRKATSLKNTTFAVQAGPVLIQENKIQPLKEGFAARTALGIKKNGHVILVISEHTQISTNFLARFMKHTLKCYSALNLDGGSSTQLYVNLPSFKKQVLGFIKLPDPICLFKR